MWMVSSTTPSRLAPLRRPPAWQTTHPLHLGPSRATHSAATISGQRNSYWVTPYGRETSRSEANTRTTIVPMHTTSWRPMLCPSRPQIPKSTKQVLLLSWSMVACSVPSMHKWAFDTSI